ncbi:hypothetical protein ZWY2020_009411 [Hordeum vulgare]|nr:hypothetical protein ZWY2020_009411 [Hordeum vulgare]
MAMKGAVALRSPSAPSSTSSSSSHATSRMQSLTRVEMPMFVCPRCRAVVDRRVSHTPKNHNRLFYVCGENGVKCFFLWVNALAKTLMNELQERA